jgi:hypothetical protein
VRPFIRRENTIQLQNGVGTAHIGIRKARRVKRAHNGRVRAGRVHRGEVRAGIVRQESGRTLRV